MVVNLLGVIVLVDSSLDVLLILLFGLELVMLWMYEFVVCCCL